MYLPHSLRLIVLAAIVSLGFIGSMGTAHPAMAATLTVTSLGCESLLSGIRCDAYVSGGTGGNTYTWTPAGTSSSSATHSTVLIKCPPGIWLSVTVTVRDSSGATASKTTNKYCSGSTP